MEPFGAMILSIRTDRNTSEESPRPCSLVSTHGKSLSLFSFGEVVVGTFWKCCWHEFLYSRQYYMVVSARFRSLLIRKLIVNLSWARENGLSTS